MRTESVMQQEVVPVFAGLASKKGRQVATIWIISTHTDVTRALAEVFGQPISKHRSQTRAAALAGLPVTSRVHWKVIAASRGDDTRDPPGTDEKALAASQFPRPRTVPSARDSSLAVPMAYENRNLCP